MKMGKTLVVLRVSTDVQDIDSQKKELIGFLNSKGLKEKDFIFLEAVGASAVKLNDKYKEFIEKIKDYCTTGKIDSIAFWHLNRLGRNDRVLSEMLYFFIDHKVQVYVKEPSFNLLDENKEPNIVSKMLWEMFSILIKSETDELKAKTKRGIDYKKAKGLYVGGKVQYGYKIVEGKRVEDVEETLFIKKVRKNYSTGKYSLKTLYEEHKGETLRGKDVSRNTIETLLGDSYKGFSTDSINKNIKIVKEKNNKVANKKHKGSYRALAVKLIKCPDCGSFLGYSKGSYFCCVHSAPWKSTKKVCNFKGTIKAEPLDNLLWELVKEIDSNKAEIIARENIYTLTKDKIELEKKLENINRLKTKALTKKDRVLDSYFNNLIDSSKRDSKIKSIEIELKDIEERVSSIKSNISIILSKIELIKSGKEEIDYSSFSEVDKYNLVHTHIKRVNIKEGKNRYNKEIKIYDKYNRLYEYDYNSRDRDKPFNLVKREVITTTYELELINRISKNRFKFPIDYF